MHLPLFLSCSYPVPSHPYPNPIVSYHIPSRHSYPIIAVRQTALSSFDELMHLRSSFEESLGGLSQGDAPSQLFSPTSGQSAESVLMLESLAISQSHCNITQGMMIYRVA